MLCCIIIKYILENRDKRLMKLRDKKKFRHKGYKQNCIKTIMGEVQYQRAIYLVEENNEKKYVFLVDENMKNEMQFLKRTMFIKQTKKYKSVEIVDIEGLEKKIKKLPTFT